MAPKPLTPHQQTKDSQSIRSIHIQHLTNLLHICLLRGNFDRAKRAWAILVRCREVDWKSRWNWGLEILSADALGETNPQQASLTQTQDAPRIERYLRQLRINGREVEKPMFLQALVLHLIKVEKYRQALDELETYLSSWPYLQSGPLHTYAGLLCFYLAQPPSARPSNAEMEKSKRARSKSKSRQQSEVSQNSSSVASASSSNKRAEEEPVNASLIRAARQWFSKALELDGQDEVSKEYIRLIDKPELSDDDSDGGNNHDLPESSTISRPGDESDLEAFDSKGDDNSDDEKHSNDADSEEEWD